MRIFSFGLLAPFAFVGFVLNLRRMRELAPIYLFILIHTGIHAITWTMIRYRMPMEPFLIIFGAYTIAQIYGRWIVPLTQTQVALSIALHTETA